MHWVFVALCRLSLVVKSGSYSLVVVHGLLIVVASVTEHGLSGLWSLAVGARGSVIAAPGLQSEVKSLSRV